MNPHNISGQIFAIRHQAFRERGIQCKAIDVGVL